MVALSNYWCSIEPLSEHEQSAADALQDQIVGFIRAFGLHQPDRTPCGQPVPVSEAQALHELGTADEPVSSSSVGGCGCRRAP